MQNAERETQNVERRTQNVERRTQNVERRTQNAERRMENGRKMAEKTYDLEERLLNYAVQIVRLVEKLPNTRAGNHIAGQLLRSGTSPLPNHGEAEGAESRNDFIHKLGICHKELRESYRWLKLIQRVPLLPPTDTALLETSFAKPMNCCEFLSRAFEPPVPTPAGKKHQSMRPNVERRTQNAERRTQNEGWRMGNVERRTSNVERRIKDGEWETGNGERRTSNAEL